MAVLCTEPIHAAIRNGSGFFQHGRAHMSHAAACAGALAVQDVIRGEGLIDKVRKDKVGKNGARFSSWKKNISPPSPMIFVLQSMQVLHTYNKILNFDGYCCFFTTESTLTVDH
ncbi:MAG: hypothetical protein GKR94_33310 [Gammaproteobacteria bacterium]|nr:hypothetical protein [Gammaproteobacteria bacterium]